MTQSFGSRLRALRREAGVSLRELARRAHLTPGHVSRIESGERQASMAAARSLMAGLGLNLAGSEKKS